jgi:glycosyltransferase involved in cell wall biosynthesis
LDTASPPLLVITRNYPPQVGGLENFSFNLINELKRLMPLQALCLNKSKHHLLWFLPYALLTGLAYASLGNVRRIHLCDGLLAPLGCLLKSLSNSSVSITVHGLDVTYANPVYQWLIASSLRFLDGIACVSQATLEECIKRRVPREKCRVIPNGIYPDRIFMATSRSDLIKEVEKGLGCSLEGRKILLTVGRLVRRKGVKWFVEQVLPFLGKSYLYIVVGNGPEFAAIQDSIRRGQLENRVILSGWQSDHFRNCLLNVADAFIMPNLNVPGDVEGFGIAALEAGACGVPVIAAGIQGIRDAVIEGVTGHLVEERNVRQYVEAIQNLNFDRDRVRAVVRQRFNWSEVAPKYQALFVEISKGLGR